MKKKINVWFVRAVSLTLTVLLLCGACGCNNTKTKVESPVLEYGEQAIPLSFYEFLLSRMKGNLARNKYDVKSDSFWDGEAVDGLTYEEYFNQSVLDSCKNYLAAAVMFDEYGLELPKSVLADIDEEIEFYIDYDGDGSRDEFNELLSQYGVDADSLREAYIIEAKYEYLLSYLYGGGSLISSAVKEEFYQENYYRFKQILISNFYYEYERDEQGNIIYFDTESGKRLYDTVNGSFIYDENGNKYRDGDGTVIYFDADGNILYDRVNGQTSAVLDESGEAVQYFYSDSEMADRRALAQEILSSVSGENHASFESLSTQYSDSSAGDESYPDGYYFSRLESGGYEDYMLDILEALEGMEVGEAALVESAYGYHIVMRYGLDSGKYSDATYAEWFTSFDGELIGKLFLAKCAEITPNIVENSENIGRARSIREIGMNFDY